MAAQLALASQQLLPIRTMGRFELEERNRIYRGEKDETLAQFVAACLVVLAHVYCLLGQSPNSEWIMLWRPWTVYQQRPNLPWNNCSRCHFSGVANAPRRRIFQLRALSTAMLLHSDPNLYCLRLMLCWQPPTTLRRWISQKLHPPLTVKVADPWTFRLSAAALLPRHMIFFLQCPPHTARRLWPYEFGQRIESHVNNYKAAGTPTHSIGVQLPYTIRAEAFVFAYATTPARQELSVSLRPDHRNNGSRQHRHPFASR